MSWWGRDGRPMEPGSVPAPSKEKVMQKGIDRNAKTPVRTGALRLVLALGAVSGWLPAGAFAATATLSQALAQMSVEPASDYVGQPGARVRDAYEFARMKAYVLAHY